MTGEADLYAAEEAEIVAQDGRLAAATTAEGTALVERGPLHERINAARAARKDPRT